MSWLRAAADRSGSGSAFAAALPFLRSADPGARRHARRERARAGNRVRARRRRSCSSRHGARRLWSPYYKITVGQEGPDTVVEVNNIFHQSMAPVEQKEYFYQWPYTVFGDTFENVLVLGAGSGTDVAAALRHGAKHVDAVEIDPVILRLGRAATIPIIRTRDPRVHGHQRRRPALPADDDEEVRPGRVRADRLADAAVELLRRAARELHVHRGVVPRRCAIGSTPNGLLVVYNYFRERWLVDRLANTAADAFGARAARARARGARLSRRHAGRAAAGDADDAIRSCRIASRRSDSRTRRARRACYGATRRSSRRPTTGRSSTCANRHIPTHYLARARR